WSTPQHPNPDYLAPYHPSLHKNVHNWSQILLDQLRQKSASSPEELEPPRDAGNTGSSGKVFSIQAALSSSVPGIAPAAPATFEGISTAPIAFASSSSDNAAGASSSTSRSTAAARRRQQVYSPAPIDKHFLFQTHHLAAVECRSETLFSDTISVRITLHIIKVIIFGIIGARGRGRKEDSEEDDSVVEGTRAIFKTTLSIHAVRATSTAAAVDSFSSLAFLHGRAATEI
ncbi:hypothetical protein BGZ96_005260, partial [Linnemannia gamsii]